MHHLCKWKVKGGIKSSDDDIDDDDVVHADGDDVVDVHDDGDDDVDADDQHHLCKWKGEGGVKSSNLSATRGTHGVRKMRRKSWKLGFSKYGHGSADFYALSVNWWYLSHLSIYARLIYLMTNYLHDTRELIPR